MKLTPLDITQQTFPTKVSGYDRVAVQHYLAELGNTVEELLRERQTLQQQLSAASTELNEKRQQEEEIRRVIVAAERIAHDMKENAIRESELLLAQTTNQIQEMQKNQEVRKAQLEMEHQGRVASLEVAFRTRFTDLEREQHDLTLGRERQHAERIGELERQFSDRYLELQSRLNSARQEYTQFLNGYRALVHSFAELSQRHSLPDSSPLAVQSASNAAIGPIEVSTELPSVNGQKFL
ncbi:DivIVA domain-containing protein [Deinococcus sp.]|uniref:DivIVA domain-containing protein n=1 Tax=Deinococcus sp. TaxID=47478 RepID=UPI0025BF86ED|nr:DivIVA domain-containing protein [Deinococcus sp.]